MDKNKVIKSTLTQGDAVLFETIPVEKIVSEYKKLLGFDVSKYFTGLAEVAVYKCNDTGFRFYYPDSIFADEEFYAFLQQREFYYNEWHWEHQQALKRLVPGSKVLEVGCGTGAFIHRLKQEGFDCAGLEINEKAIEVCKQKGLKVYKEFLETHALQHAGQYDAVCSFQVLEHVYDVRSYINACLACLKPGGKLIFAVPNNNPYMFKYDKYQTMNLPPHHSGLWSKASFKKLPAFFPVELEAIEFEPLYNRAYFLSIYFRHFKMGWLSKIIDKMSPRISNTLLWPLKLFVNGTSMLAVFIRRQPTDNSQ